MLDVSVAEVVLQRTGIVAVICEFVATGMAEHVGMDWEFNTGHLTGPSHNLSNRSRSYRSTTL